MYCTQAARPGLSVFRPFLEHLGNVESDAENDPEARRQHVGIRREFITEINYTPSLRKAPVEKVLADMIQDGADPFSITATPRDNSDPSSPPAESSGDTSITHRTKPGTKPPTDSPDEAKKPASLELVTARSSSSNWLQP